MAGPLVITLSPAPHDPGETVVKVDHRFPDRAEEGRNPFRLVSSCVYGPRLGPEFDAALVRVVDARLRNRRGRRKGRVLYVIADDEPVAALAYHLPREDEEPVCVLGAGAAEWVDDELAGGAMMLIAYLVECAMAVNVKLGRGRRLAWATDSDETAQALHGQWGFSGVPHWRAPEGIRTRHYLVCEDP